MIDTALILCGGKGTRMGQMTETLPKPMLPLLGKPVLEHLVHQCKKNNITKILLITGYLGHVIRDHFGDGSPWEVSIDYFQEDEPLGTTGAIKLLEDNLPEAFWIFYGDVIFDMDLQRMIQFHREKQSALTIVVHPNDHPYDSDLIVTDASHKVTHVHPKPHPKGLRARNLVNAALYLTQKETVSHLPHGKSDWGRDQLPVLCKKIPVYAYRTSEYIKDMGTPDRIFIVERDVQSAKPARRNLKNRQKAIFLDRDGVLNEDHDLIHTPEQLHVYSFAAEAVRKINQSDYLSIVVTNQSIIARGLTDDQGLESIHAALDDALAQGHAFLDDLYYCPHHPDKGFPGEVPELKISCECRKPAPGMLLKAAEKYNIDLSQSWMIGDRNADIEAGRRAGCTTVGVLTGNALHHIQTAPDFIFHDLYQAVDYIVTDPHRSPSDIIFQNINQSSKRPYLIGICGNTGSGKSTFTSYLTRYLRLRSRNVLKIELDHWILPVEQRTGNHDLNNIYQTDRINTDLRRVFSWESVSPPGYRRHPTWKTSPPQYQIKPDTDVVIIEGIVAFMTEVLDRPYDLKIFCEVTDQKFIYNLYRLNSWKGRTDEEINKLIKSREKSEYQKIRNQKNLADMIITLN